MLGTGGSLLGGPATLSGQSPAYPYAIQKEQGQPVKTVGVMVGRLDLFIDRLTKLYAQVDKIGVRLNGHLPLPIPNEAKECKPMPAGLTWELDAKLDIIADAILMLEAAVKRVETAVG